MFRHIFPPQTPLRRRSYFGGAPLAPKDFVWPVAVNEDGARRPLDFMAQIDCADIPDGQLRKFLPDRGVLYFFAPLDDAVSRADGAVCVRLADGPPSDFTLISAPERPRDALGNWRYDWVAASAQERAIGRRRLPRIEVECGWAPAFRPPELERELTTDDVAFEEWRKRRDEALISFHGAPARIDESLSAQALRGDRIFAPFDGFPSFSMAIDMVASLFLRGCATSPCEDAQAEREARRLRDAARSKDPLSEPSADEKQDFISWLRRLEGSPELNLQSDAPGARALAREIPGWISQAAIVSSEAALADSIAAKRVPPAVALALRHRHSALTSPAFEAGAARHHQMFGHARLTFGQSEEMALTHHLLMQFDADEALGWDFGDGAFQYWITPADLAARRFSSVALTFEGG
jgi:hypothetical protein